MINYLENLNNLKINALYDFLKFIEQYGTDNTFDFGSILSLYGIQNDYDIDKFVVINNNDECTTDIEIHHIDGSVINISECCADDIIKFYELSYVFTMAAIYNLKIKKPILNEKNIMNAIYNLYARSIGTKAKVKFLGEDKQVELEDLDIFFAKSIETTDFLEDLYDNNSNFDDADYDEDDENEFDSEDQEKPESCLMGNEYAYFEIKIDKGVLCIEMTNYIGDCPLVIPLSEIGGMQLLFFYDLINQHKVKMED